MLAALEQLTSSAPWPRVSTLEQLERAFEAWKTAVTPPLIPLALTPPPSPPRNQQERGTPARHGSCLGHGPKPNHSPPTGSLS